MHVAQLFLYLVKTFLYEDFVWNELVVNSMSVGCVINRHSEPQSVHGHLKD